MEHEYDAYVGDVGVEIVLDVVADISKATVMKIKYKKTNGERAVWNAEKKDATKIFYVTGHGDLDDAGIWETQAYVESPGWKLHGKVDKLYIGGILT